jgi:hypothetical protein
MEVFVLKKGKPARENPWAHGYKRAWDGIKYPPRTSYLHASFVSFVVGVRVKCSRPTYSTPKSSRMRQNLMGLHLWRQRLGVEVAS